MRLCVEQKVSLGNFQTIARRNPTRPWSISLVGRVINNTFRIGSWLSTSEKWLYVWKLLHYCILEFGLRKKYCLFFFFCGVAI
jgi:hypothetical protein